MLEPSGVRIWLAARSTTFATALPTDLIKVLWLW
jgi:hypothetical protein